MSTLGPSESTKTAPHSFSGPTRLQLPRANCSKNQTSTDTERFVACTVSDTMQAHTFEPRVVNWLITQLRLVPESGPREYLRKPIHN